MRRKQFEKLQVHDFTESTFHLPAHSHTYYELVYIHNGKGVHLLNSVEIPYIAGNLFLISPEDVHNFDIKARTHFTFIKFTDAYFSSSINKSKNQKIPAPEKFMTKAIFKERAIQFSSVQKKVLKQLVKSIVALDEASDIQNSDAAYYLMAAIFGLLNDANQDVDVQTTDRDRVSNIISYVHNHIYQPKKLRVSEISDRFNMSSHYFGAYFKKNIGLSYRDYLNNYKLGLIETRLSQQVLNKSEIAAEFGFTDTSHLLHFLQNCHRISENTRADVGNTFLEKKPANKSVFRSLKK